MKNLDLKNNTLDQSRFLLKEGALNVVKNLEPLLEKEPLNSLGPTRLAIAYKILGEFQKSRRMEELSKRIEERLRHGYSLPAGEERQLSQKTDSEDTLLPKEFAEGLFSGLTHPIAFFHHVESFKKVLKEPKFLHRLANIAGRFCGGMPAAYGVVYSFSRYYDDPIVVLPLGLSLIATNSASAYRFLCKALSFNFESLDDDSLIGFYKAFKGDLRGAYNIFRRKEDSVRISMVGDFYLDEAEANIKMLEKQGLISLHIMDLLMRKALIIYEKMHDPTNIGRIASGFMNEGFIESSNELWEKYYAFKKEKKKDGIVASNRRKEPIFHLSRKDREILIKECTEMYRQRYKGRQVSLPYTPRREASLYKALYLLDNYEGERDMAYCMTKAQVYRMLGFKKSAEKYESIIHSMEMNRIAMEEKAKMLQKLKKFNVHSRSIDKIITPQTMGMRGYLSDEAVEYLSR